MIKFSSVLVVATIAITTFAMPHPAQSKGFFETMFGNNEAEAPKGPPPEETLQAPFPTNQVTITNKSQLMDIYGDDSNSLDTLNDLSLAHRNEKQIVEWTTEIVSQAMTINPKTYENDFKKIAPHFNHFALQEYNQYMTKTNMVNVLISNASRFQAMTDGDGSVIKEGEILGTYHWLVQIPIMASFYKDNIQSVDKTANIQNQNLMVQVQVGRVKQKDGSDMGIVVERWSVSSNAKE